MIKKLIRQMLAAQILSALTVSLCLLIDNIMIGQFLGNKAIAAYGLANPLLLLIGALGTMLSAGAQVTCSRSLGRGLQEETNKGYSSALAIGAAISIVFVTVVLLLNDPLARLLGGGRDPELFANTRDYLIGFVIGAPASMGALILVPFLQMAGKSNLLIAAVLGMTVSDVAFDLLNVLVFHGGMFGMGLASSLSYYVAVVVGSTYFLSKKCVFRFSRQGIGKAKIREILVGGVPSLFSMAASVILVYVMNQLILRSNTGSAGVTAFTVISTLGGASNCISTGMNGVALTLTGILYNEEDRNGLKHLLTYLLKISAFLDIAVGILLFAFAPLLAGLFIKTAGPTKDLAVYGLRIYAPGLAFCCMICALKGIYQGTNRPGLTEIVCLGEGAVMPILAAVVMQWIQGTRGLWLYFSGGETLMILFILAVVAVMTKRNPLRSENILLLRPDFGVTEENMMEMDVRTMDDVITASVASGKFCREHGQPVRVSNHVALCVEEIARNVVQHGFQDGKYHSLSIRLQHKDGRWILRFRDNGTSFDPVSYVPASDDPASGMGIRLVMRMADEVRYTYSMSLNNLTVIFREQPEKRTDAAPKTA